MDAVNNPNEALKLIANRCENCHLAEHENAVELVIQKATFVATVTLPRGVHEWYVDATDAISGFVVHDWYDYDGYESEEGESVDAQMVSDLMQVIDKLLSHPVRIRSIDAKKVRAVLDCQIGGAWQQVIPFVLE